MHHHWFEFDKQDTFGSTRYDSVFDLAQVNKGSWCDAILHGLLHMFYLVVLQVTAGANSANPKYE